ncbi:hypothetical protein JE951_002248 [Flavobacterium psychrophilum]|nr:hypothetical protein [Flavobacterium psychrophilum]
MKKASDFISGTIGLIFLGGILYFLFIGIKILASNFDEININIFVAIIGGTITISSFFITRYLEKRKNIEIEIRNKKIPIYEEFFEFYFKVVYGNKIEGSLSNEDMIKFFRSFNQKAIIWFPDNILKSYVNWKKNLIHFSNNNSNDNLKKLIIEQEELMHQFRKDIGHSNKNLIRGDISSLYINDIEEFI